MFKKFSSLLVALGAAASLFATDVRADDPPPPSVTVTAGQNTATPGQQDVGVSLAFSNPVDIDLTKMASFQLNLLYDPTVLSFSHIVTGTELPGAGTTMITPLTTLGWNVSLSDDGLGAATLIWLDDDFDHTTDSFDMSGSFFKVFFDVRFDAPTGPTYITFGDTFATSNLNDVYHISPDDNGYVPFSDVTQGDQMTITVSAVPEPAEISMLLAGLGLIGAVARRRRRQQAVGA